MILAACGGRGNGEKDAGGGWQGLKAGRIMERWEVGRVDRKEGEWQGVDGNGEGRWGGKQ